MQFKYFNTILFLFLILFFYLESVQCFSFTSKQFQYLSTLTLDLSFIINHHFLAFTISTTLHAYKFSQNNHLDLGWFRIVCKIDFTVFRKLLVVSGTSK